MKVTLANGSTAFSWNQLRQPTILTHVNVTINKLLIFKTSL